MINCNFCAFTSKYQSQVNYHGLYQHHYCVSCKKKCETFEGILDHQKNYHDREFTCNICSKKFLDATRLQQHLKIHSGIVKVKIHHCEFCEFEFDNPSTLYRHYNLIHFHCIKCETTFGDRDKMFDHLKELHGKDNSCQFCTHNFSSKSGLRCHLETIHYYCDVCDIAHETRGEILDHLDEKHKRKHQCSSCQMRFFYAKELNRHEVRRHQKNSKHYKYLRCDQWEISDRLVEDYKNYCPP